MALPPAAPTCAAVSLTRSAERAVQTTRAPSRAKRRLMTRPMPLDAPVTMATFPSSKPMRNLPPVVLLDVLLNVDPGGARPGPSPVPGERLPGERTRAATAWPADGGSATPHLVPVARPRARSPFRYNQ